MNKEKQIEEMESMINDYLQGLIEGNELTLAKKIYEKGYRKINENEIVMSKEEKQKLLKEMYEQGRFDALADLEKEGKVVISKEELDILKDIGNLKNKVQEALNINPIEELIQVERTARKETAREILKYLLKVGNTEKLGYLKVYIENIESLAEKHGVEI